MKTSPVLDLAFNTSIDEPMVIGQAHEVLMKLGIKFTNIDIQVFKASDTWVKAAKAKAIEVVCLDEKGNQTYALIMPETLKGTETITLEKEVPLSKEAESSFGDLVQSKDNVETDSAVKFEKPALKALIEPSPEFWLRHGISIGNPCSVVLTYI